MIPSTASEMACLICSIVSPFTMLTIACGLYILDVSTDVHFTNDMFLKSKRNFSEERIKCSANFHVEFKNAIQNCHETNFNSAICMKTLSFVKKTGQECFENEERFSNPMDWHIIGVVSGFHCGLTVVVSFIIWAAAEFGRECGAASIVNLPIPVITKFYRFLLDIKLYRNFAWSDRNKSPENEKEYEATKKEIDDKISAHENVVNLSLIIEASVESSFQFFFQTIFILPTVILAFTDQSGGFELTDFISFRFLSIGLSFASFSFGFYQIR